MKDSKNEEILEESKIDRVTAREILAKHDAHGTDFHALKRDQVLGLSDSAKEHGYKRSKSAPGSTARMFHQHLHRLVGEDTNMTDDSLDEGNVESKHKKNEYIMDQGKKRLLRRARRWSTEGPNTLKKHYASLATKAVKYGRDDELRRAGRLQRDEDTTMTDEPLNEMMTRKHFQQVADVIKHVEDPKKRHELAQHHAAIFKASNSRFDHSRFYTAANAHPNHIAQGKPIQVKLKTPMPANEDTNMEEISTEDILRSGPEALLDVILDGSREAANDIFQSVMDAKVAVALDAASIAVSQNMCTGELSEIEEAMVTSLSETLTEEQLNELMEAIDSSSPEARAKNAKVHAHLADVQKHLSGGDHDNAKASAVKATFAAIRAGNTHQANSLRKFAASIRGSKFRNPAQRNTRRAMTQFNSADLSDILGIEMTEEQVSAIDEKLNLWRPELSGFKKKGVGMSKRAKAYEPIKPPIADKITHGAGSGVMRHSVNKKWNPKKKKLSEAKELIEAGHHHHVFADLTHQRKNMADAVANSFMRGHVSSDHKREILRHFNLADEQLGMAKDCMGSAKCAEHLNVAATHITNGGAAHANFSQNKGPSPIGY
jgi:hypothetical protein